MQPFQRSKQFLGISGMLLLVLILLTSCQNTLVLEPTWQPPTATLPIVPSRVVTLSNNTPLPRTSTPSPEVTSPVGPKVMLKGDGMVNVRSGPGTLYPIVGRVTTGTAFVVLARSEYGEWLLLAYPDAPGGKAWIYAAYTDYNSSLHPLPVATAAQPGASLQEPATAAPGLSNDPMQTSAIEKVLAALELPRLPLTFVETTNMMNSPTGGLKVSIFQDTDGRSYSLVPTAGRVVEIDARSLLPGLPTDAPILTEEELKSKAIKYFQATVPDFAALQPSLQYEEGGKGDLYFYTWRGPLTPGSVNSPFVQIGLHKSGFPLCLLQYLAARSIRNQIVTAQAGGVFVCFLREA